MLYIISFLLLLIVILLYRIYKLLFLELNKVPEETLEEISEETSDNSFFDGYKENYLLDNYSLGIRPVYENKIGFQFTNIKK